MNKSFKAAGDILGEPGLRRNIKVGLLALVLCDVLLYMFALGPLSESDRERRMQVENLRHQVRDRTVQIQKLSALVQKVETARTEGDKLLGNITMPRRTAFSTIVSELDQAGSKAGVELRDRGLSVEPIEGSDTLSMLTVTQGLEGSYDNLVRFLNMLDRSPRFLIIESLGAAPQQQSQSGQKQQQGALLNVTLKLDSFMREM